MFVVYVYLIHTSKCYAPSSARQPHLKCSVGPHALLLFYYLHHLLLCARLLDVKIVFSDVATNLEHQEVRNIFYFVHAAWYVGKIHLCYPLLFSWYVYIIITSLFDINEIYTYYARKYQQSQTIGARR